MKILMVSIPSLHFFRWTAQLQDSGHEIYWFDITGMSDKVERLNWVSQKTGWKLKWNYPGRLFIKKNLTKVYQFLQSFNEYKTAPVFEQYLNEIKPDVVHSFAMQLSCVPILISMKQYEYVKWIYSSWGSDMFLHEKLGVSKELFTETLERVNYLITDCKRDYQIALDNSFKNNFLGVYIGNGGLFIEKKAILEFNERNVLLVKGYEDGVGKALEIIKAIESLPINLFDKIEIIVYSADSTLKEYIEKADYFKHLKIEVILRGYFISNNLLLEIMGKSIVHIANSISDGLPASAIEAMGMGAFPIQSNPGKVSEEVIIHGKNGYLIENPFDSKEIAKCIEDSLRNVELRKNAQEYNVDFVNENYNRAFLKKQIEKMYESIH